jgi:hypothetical protein
MHTLSPRPRQLKPVGAGHAAANVIEFEAVLF